MEQEIGRTGGAAAGLGSIAARGARSEKNRTRPYGTGDGAGGRVGCRIGVGRRPGARTEKSGQDPMKQEMGQTDGAAAGWKAATEVCRAAFRQNAQRPHAEDGFGAAARCRAWW